MANIARHPFFVQLVRADVCEKAIQFLTASFRVFFIQKISYFSEVFLPVTKTKQSSDSFSVKKIGSNE